MDGLGLEDLARGERLLLGGLRQLALGAPCGGWRSRFEVACGYAGGEAACALLAFVEQLRLKARRRIGFSLPGSPVSADEARLLALFACAQAEDYRRLDEALGELLGAPPPACLGAAVCLIAQAMAMTDHALPLRERDVGAPARSWRPRTPGARYEEAPARGASVRS